MKKTIQKLYVICIISVIGVTFIQEFVPLDFLVSIKTVLLIGVLGIGIFFTKGLMLYMSVLLLSIGHLLILKYNIGYDVWLEGITKNLPLATIFVVVPIISIPLRLGGYLDSINYYFRKNIKNKGLLFTIINSFAFAFGSITNMGVIRIAHSMLEDVRLPTRFLAGAYSLGYVSCVAWSPYFASVNLVLYYTGLSLGKYFIYGFIYGLSILIMGNLLFRMGRSFGYGFPPEVEGSQGSYKDPDNKDDADFCTDPDRKRSLDARLKQLVIVLCGLMVAVFALEQLTNLSNTMYLVSMIAIVYSILWSMALKKLGPYIQALKGYDKTILQVKSEMVFFLCVGLFGVVISHTPLRVAIQYVFSELSGLPVFFLIEAVILTIIVLSVAGLHPGITVTILGLTISPAVLGISTIAYALTLVSGWLISMFVSPFVVTNIVLSGIFRKSPFLIGLKWNRVIGIVVFIFSGIYITLVNML